MLHRNMMISSVFAWFSLLTVVDSANILAIFPTPSRSHMQFHVAILKSLHDAGHNITLISLVLDDELVQNFTKVNLQDTVMLIGKFNINQYRSVPGTKHLEIITRIGEKLCEDVLQLPEVQNLLHSTTKEYDVIFLQIWTIHECFLPLAEKLRIPVIGTVTWPSFRRADTSVGIPSNPSVIPQNFGEYNDQMTFFQRLKNTWGFLATEYDYYFTIRPKLNRIYAKYYSQDLLYKKKIDLLFNCNHPSIFPRITVPNAIDIAGIHILPTKPLPEMPKISGFNYTALTKIPLCLKNVQEFIDAAKYGVILFSLGALANSRTMSSEMIASFTAAFAGIPQRVIWKHGDKIDGISENVLLMDWVPQRDILAHKNVKAFITHCGLSSIQEAIHEAVPLILTPLFIDQNMNAAFLEKLGVGIRLDIFTTTTEIIFQALNGIINDTRYRNNMKQLSRTFKDRPMTPQQSVVYWTEYVIRYEGAMHLRTAGADMPFYQYFLIDILMFIIAGIILVSFIVRYIIQKISVFASKYLKSKSIKVKKTN